MPAANCTFHGEQVQPTAQISSLPMPHDWPKFVMTLTAAGILVMLVLLRLQ
jgi:hypothetical protein